MTARIASATPSATKRGINRYRVLHWFWRSVILVAVAGGSGVWGEIPMPPQELPEADTKAMATWLATGAGK